MRWKPAKAFLVDDRNALVHEFTLDPTCAVPFPEAVAAGALHANGAAVRVSRFFAQTVRAGGMALVVLSNGPAEPETVELSRQILLGTLSRLGDWARDRLELARAEELRLESERRRIASWSANVQARERGVAGLQEATAVTHERIAADAAALASRAQAHSANETALKDREAIVGRREAAVGSREAEADTRIVQDRAAFDAVVAKEKSEFAAWRDAEKAAIESAREEIETKSRTTEARDEGTRDREAHAELVERALSEREARLSAAESNVLEREREIAGREAESESFFQELSVKVAQNAKWEKSLRATAADIERRAKELGVDVDVPKRESEPARGKRASAKT